MFTLRKEWQDILQEEMEKPYYKDLLAKLRIAYETKEIYPREEEVFAALNLTPPKEVKAVVLGQDPYHQPGQAHGLSFSVQTGVAIPPSLRNIYKELAEDLGITPPFHGDLRAWAQEGVLLLNSTLTVEKGRANAHKDFGWERFTDRIIRYLDQQEQAMVFILLGAFAQKKESLLSNPNHYIIKAPHPSPLAAYRGFFGSKIFSKTNDYLIAAGREPIQWTLPLIKVQP